MALHGSWKWKRAAVWACVLLLMALLVVLALAPSPVTVDLAPVTRGELRVTLDHEGKTQVRNRYVVSAPVAGRVMRIDLEPGTPVQAGRTVVAAFRPAVPELLNERMRSEAKARAQASEAAVERARADLARARAEREHAESELKRTEGMAREGVVPPSVLDAARTEARTAAEAEAAADYTLRSAQHDLEAARAALIEPSGAAAGRELQIHAPVTGVVLQRLRESEAVVPAGEPLLEIADPADLEVVSDYLSTDAVEMRPGMPVEIDRWGGDRVLEGAVRLVDPHGFTKVSALGVEEQRVNVITRFVQPRTDWSVLGDGYRVETRVIVWQRSGVLKVPESSLFRRGEKWAVFVDENGRARERTIEVGRRNGLEAEVVKGLSEGERVVLHPPENLTPGARIEPRA
jgi:HlyD family secretion protein